MFGCIIACIVLLLCYALEPNSGIPFWQGAVGFLVLFFLVFWNLSIELGKK